MDMPAKPINTAALQGDGLGCHTGKDQMLAAAEAAGAAGISRRVLANRNQRAGNLYL